MREVEDPALRVMEFSSMALGLKALSLIALVAYLLAVLSKLRAERANQQGSL